MDLKVDFEGRDLAQTPQGWVVPITGAEEIAQRLHLRLGVRRGSFRLDPELGSRLYSLSRSTPQPAADKAELDCRFSWSGQELETTLEV